MKIAKQSKLGITSFILAIIPIATFILLLIVAILATLPHTGGCKGCENTDKNALGFIIIYLIMITLVIPLEATGFIFGLASLFQKKVKNTYGKLGVVICGIFIILVVLYFLGMIK